MFEPPEPVSVAVTAPNGVDPLGSSMAKTTMIVSPTDAVMPLAIVSEVLLAVSFPTELRAVREVGGTRIVMPKAAEADETFPAASVAVAVMLWEPALRALVAI